MTEKNMFLEIKLQKTSPGIYAFRIVNQDSLKISYKSNIYNYSIISQSAPEITNDVLYVRGSSADSDHTVLRVNEERLLRVIGVLFEYVKVKDRKIQITQIDNNYIKFAINRREGLESTDELMHSFTNKVKSLNFTKLMESVPEVCTKCNTNISDDPNNLTKIKLDRRIHYICLECIKSIPVCDICNVTALNITKVKDSLNNEYNVCKVCSELFRCNNCGNYELSKFATRTIEILDTAQAETNTSSYICKACVPKNSIKCINCNCSFNSDKYSICPCEIPEDFVRYINEHNADVLNYLSADSFNKNFIVSEKLLKEPTQFVELFGMELEVGSKRQNRSNYLECHTQTNNAIREDAIMKYDSSIDYINKAERIRNTYRGFEIVTRPLIYKNMVKFLKNLTSTRHKDLESWKVGTTGIHIHVSKSCLSKLDRGKILVFINSKENRKFITHIARRESKRFAEFKNKTFRDYDNDDFAACHYEAVNTAKKHTIEFRIFRGSLNLVTILSYLQFVKSTIDFVKCTSYSKLNYVDFINWLFMNTNDSKFKELKYHIAWWTFTKNCKLKNTNLVNKITTWLHRYKEVSKQIFDEKGNILINSISEEEEI